MIIELFSKSDLLGSYLIRAHPSEWGPWSHCAYLHPQLNLVVESVFPHGVQVITFDEWIGDKHKTAWAERKREYTDAVWYCAAAEEGKPYDKSGVLGLGLNRDWQNPEKWWCSELNEYAAQQHGFGVYVPEYVNRVGVHDRWKIQ